MIIPLNKLIEFKGNRYKLARAVMKRAEQLSLVGDEELEKNNYKIVPTALEQILSGKVKYD